MSSQNFNSDYTERNRFQYQAYTTNSSVVTAVNPPTPSQTTILHLPLPQVRHQHSEPPSTASEQPTVIPFAPSPPSPPSSTSPSEIYGPDRHALFSQQPALNHANSSISHHPFGRGPPELQHLAMADPFVIDPLAVVRDEGLKDELVRGVEASITPGVDNSPFVRYALDAMSAWRDNEDDAQSRSSYGDSGNPIFRVMPNSVPGLFQPAPAHFSGSSSRYTGHTRRYSSLPPSRHPIEEAGAEAEAEPLTGANYPTEGTIYEPRQNVTPEAERAARRWRHRGDSKGEIILPYTPPPRNNNKEEAIKKFLAAGHRHAQAQAEARLLGVPYEPTPPPARKALPRTQGLWEAEGDEPGDAEKGGSNPRLDHKPWILRTESLLLFAGLCALMIVALMFSALYSSGHGDGLKAYSGTIYDGNWFVFRIMPQLFAAVLLIYAQNIVTTAFRVLPFSAMASDDVRERRNVGFLPLYPRSFLWPELVSTWHFYTPVIVTWCLNFTIPLQSCLFTVVLVDGTWTWKTVQGVAWFLFFLYLSMLVSTLLVVQFWHNRRTGFLSNWDMRTLADIIMLVAQSNSVEAYRGTETAARKTELRHMLYGNVERLGYWFTPDAPQNNKFYSIGVSSSQQHLDIEKLGPPIHMKDPQGQVQYTSLAGVEGGANHASVRYRYLPWCIRNSQMTLWVVAASILLITLFAVSFNPATDIRRGFLPGLSAAPTPGDFSAADFLYAFVPSLLGLILFLMFQSLDLTLRILTPWGELSRKQGSRARTSILLDYAACLPFEATWKAIKNRHWRVAVVSFLSTFFILIPVLAGGVFMALTPSSGIVRMYANIPVFAILLTLLVLYLLALVSLIPNRSQFRLPHGVTCLAEIISFCYNDELRTDHAFELPPNQRYLKAQCGAYTDIHRQSRWRFGTGSNGNETLGIKKISRFTVNPRKLRNQDRRAIQDVISKPLRGRTNSMMGV